MEAEEEEEEEEGVVVVVRARGEEAAANQQRITDQRGRLSPAPGKHHTGKIAGGHSTKIGGATNLVDASQIRGGAGECPPPVLAQRPPEKWPGLAWSELGALALLEIGLARPK